jgi:hypothetical protein
MTDEKPMDWLHDQRTGCISALVTMATRDYLRLVGQAHEQRGAIAGQRDVLKTTTAKRIRDRMVEDIRKGAVLPPVVIGMVVDRSTLTAWEESPPSETHFLAVVAQNQLAIIDGMQRTAGLKDAATTDPAVYDRPLRVEFWVADETRALVYRMLVLNTGQIPWTLGRQLAVVYEPLLREVKARVKNIDKVFTPDKQGRRVAGGQFNLDSLVELYLAFSLRKTTVDTQESLSEEFSRLDFVDNLSDPRFQDQFYQALGTLTGMDICFARYENPNGGKFSKGREIFDRHPARIGYMVAVSQYALGRPGLDREPAERAERIETVTQEAGTLITRLNEMTEQQLGEFLKLDVLSELLDRKVGQVGRYERGLFNEAFKVLIEEHFNVPTMEPCWRAS